MYARVRARETKSERSGFLSEVVSFTSEKNKTTSDVDETTSEKKEGAFHAAEATPLHTFGHFRGEKAWTNRKNGGILTTFLHKNQEDEQE